MKFNLTTAESQWINEKMGQLQTISAAKPETADMAHLCNRIRYNTDGAPTRVFLTRPQRALVTEVAQFRFQSLDLIPCEERDVVQALIKKVGL